jgi:ABC-type multidrug transport system fused ATPase/permease subunit
VVLQEALDRIMTGRTSVVVAHRLSTIRNADSIAVVYRWVAVCEVQGSGQAVIAHCSTGILPSMLHNGGLGCIRHTGTPVS